MLIRIDKKNQNTIDSCDCHNEYYFRKKEICSFNDLKDNFGIGSKTSCYCSRTKILSLLTETNILAFSYSNKINLSLRQS